MRILDGVRVVDLCPYVPGPFATLMLRDLGASVVKIEPPDGDPMRQMGAMNEADQSAGYRALNGGKTVVRLDLKTAEGQEVCAALLAKADVLISSFRPGVLDRLGFGAERLAALRPGLIHVALSGWGQSGPYRHRAGHDITYMALGGGLAQSGTGPLPGFGFPPVSDYAAGMQAAFAAVTALLGLARGTLAVPPDRPVELDVSMMETVLAWQAAALNEAQAGQPQERRSLTLNGGAACYQVYRTRDGRCLAVGALERKFWEAFCRVLDQPDWIPRQWESMPQRRLIADVGDVIRLKTLAEWTELFEPADCCVEPVWLPDEVIAHPQILARNLLRRPTEGLELHVLLPLLINGDSAKTRPPLEEIGAAAALARWPATVGATVPATPQAAPGTAADPTDPAESDVATALMDTEGMAAD